MHEAHQIFYQKIYFWGNLPTSLPSLCFQFLMESPLLIYFYYFVFIILIILCSFLCLSVFHICSLSLDHILLIAARILALLIIFSTLSMKPFSPIQRLHSRHMSKWLKVCNFLPRAGKLKCCVKTPTLTMFTMFTVVIHIVDQFNTSWFTNVIHILKD